MTHQVLLTELNRAHAVGNNKTGAPVGRAPNTEPADYWCTFGERLFLDVIGTRESIRGRGLLRLTDHLETVAAGFGTRIAYRALFTFEGFPTDPIHQQRATLLLWAAGKDPKPYGLGASVFPDYVDTRKLEDAARLDDE